MKIPTLSLLSIMATGCVDVEVDKVPASNQISAQAARAVIDTSAFVGYPRACQDLEDKLAEQALFFVENTDSVSNDTAILSDNITTVTLIKSDINNGVRDLIVEFNAEEFPEGAFVGKIVLSCNEEES